MFKEKSVFLVLLMALAISVLSVVQWNQTVFVCQLLQGILALAILGIFVLEIIIAVRSNEKEVKRQKLKNMILFLIFILIIPITSYLVRTDGGKKVLIRAEASDPPAFLNLYLFSDNTFKLWHSGPVAGTYYRGAYNLHDDTLHIDNEMLIYLFPNLTLVMRQEASDQRKYFESVHSEEDTAYIKHLLYILKAPH